jgi:DNA-binding XRE family transcriptional regulator
MERVSSFRSGFEEMGKTALVAIESLEKQLRKRFPDAIIALDRPRNRLGNWFLDVARGEHPVIIWWKDGAGFGVSSAPNHAYGENPDEVYLDEEAVYGRVVSLLLSGSFTSPPEPVRLKELRKARGLSQSELADILHKQQGEVSKIERRQDVKLSTLRDYVESVGGTLQVLARLPGGVVKSIEIEEQPTDSQRKKAPPTGRELGERG